MANNIHAKQQRGQAADATQIHAVRVRWGVASRLFLAFCVITLMTMLLAYVGDRGLVGSRRTLEASRDSFERVSTVLEDTTASLEAAGATIDKAGVTLGDAVTTMEETSARVNNLNSVDLPAVIAIGSIREALTAVAVGERTLLMRQLYDPAIREQQRLAIEDALDRGAQALSGFSRIEAELSDDKREAWRQFLLSWEEWLGVHERLMSEFDAIDAMLADRVRGGFEFEEVAKRAFDIAFGEGQTARDTVNRRLDAVVVLISDSARVSAGVASEDTRNATTDSITAKDDLAKATSEIRSFKDQMRRVNAQVKETTDATKAAIDNAQSARNQFILFIVVGFAFSIFFAVLQTRNLSRPIRDAAAQMGLLAEGKIDRDIMGRYVGRSDEIGVLARSIGVMLVAQREEVDIAGHMAAGDFSGSVRLRSDEDKLGGALSKMMRITHDALERVNRHVQQVTEGAKAISTASQSLSVSSVEAASALVEISASTTQIGEQTHQNAQSAAQANEFAISSREVAEKGYEAVEEMVASMREIQTSSAQIAQIVKLIDDIAFQTNLLALNAAVEAARAGRQGKGFSVVAGEVRNLAARSAKAARETAALVEVTVQRVENGAAIAMRTDAAFKEILENAQRTADLYGEIAASSQNQSRSIDQIAVGLAQIDNSTQQNSRYASQTASAAQALSRQTDELRRMMIRFQLQGGAGAIDAPGGEAAAALPHRPTRQGYSGGTRRLGFTTPEE